MEQEKIHLLIYGANFFERNASSQRVKNLVFPLIKKNQLIVSNLIVNANKNIEEEFEFPINYLNASYKFYNPFSILIFFYKSYIFIKRHRNKKKTDVFFCYDYPNIENITILFFAKWLGYKIAFDIVENYSNINLSKSSWEYRFKIYTLIRMQKLIPRLGSACFAISSSLVKYCRQICKNSIPVIHLPICVDIDYIKCIERYPKDHNIIKVFYGGSFGFKDGIPFLIKAFERACLQSDCLELLLTGKLSKDHMNDIELLINKSPVKEKIKFLGCLPIAEYFKVMVNSDILCMLRVNSAFANAGFPFKLGEYLASGNAIIATNIGDVSHYIQNRYNALLIPPESEVLICEAIIELANNEGFRKRIGLEAFETAKNFFSSHKISEILYLNIKKLSN